MKAVLLAASAAVLSISFGSVAQAADVSAPPSSYDWTGFYVGVNAGAAIDNGQVDYTFAGPFSISGETDSNESAFTAGGNIGYNYQIDRAVLGIEADFNYLGLSADHNHSATKDLETAGGDPFTLYTKSSATTEMDWFGTIRGRLGYTVDNLLLYGTGGLAYGHTSVSENWTGDASPPGRGDVHVELDGNANDTQWGWTVGGGLEYGIDRWSIGAEYLYVNLGSSNWSTNEWQGFRPGAVFGVNGDVDWGFSVVRATAKMRF